MCCDLKTRVCEIYGILNPHFIPLKNIYNCVAVNPLARCVTFHKFHAFEGPKRQRCLR